MEFIKQTKTQVIAEVLKTGEWRGFFCPSKCRPNPAHPFNMAMPVTVTREMLDPDPRKLYGESAFEKLLTEFEYYNCSLPETGKRVHYYKIAPAPVV